MHKLQTTLKNFRFNSIICKGPVKVNWYKLETTDDESSGICLNQDEIQQLANYVAYNKENFEDQNYFNCDSDEVPFSSLYNLLPINGNFPELIIIRKKPQLINTDGEVYRCMDIELLTAQNTSNHNYSLPFDIIGEILN